MAIRTKIRIQKATEAEKALLAAKESEQLAGSSKPAMDDNKANLPQRLNNGPSSPERVDYVSEAASLLTLPRVRQPGETIEQYEERRYKHPLRMCPVHLIVIFVVVIVVLVV
jgi:hypothetical protein